MSGCSCQKGNTSSPEIFIVNHSNPFFNKLVLNPVITDSFYILFKKKLLVNIALMHKFITGTVWLLKIILKTADLFLV